MTIQNCLLRFWLWLAVVAVASAAEVMPPKPAQWFNDYAGVVPTDTASQLNAKLQQFERDTSNQIVVAVWRDMQTDTSVQDYTYRIAESWKVGNKDRKNGTILFVFINARKMFIQVGYGLEGALPDALAKRIIEDEIAPQFKKGDFGVGLAAGVDAILAATKGEYKGSGRSAVEIEHTPGIIFRLIVLFFALSILCLIISFARSGDVISKQGRRRNVSYGGGWSSGGSSSSGGRGGWSSGGGGGFSSGGGSFGGGGAGGSW